MTQPSGQCPHPSLNDILALCHAVSHVSKAPGFQFKCKPAITWVFHSTTDFVAAKMHLQNLLTVLPWREENPVRWGTDYMVEVDIYGVSFRLVGPTVARPLRFPKIAPRDNS